MLNAATIFTMQHHLGSKPSATNASSSPMLGNGLGPVSFNGTCPGKRRQQGWDHDRLVLMFMAKFALTANVSVERRQLSHLSRVVNGLT